MSNSDAAPVAAPTIEQLRKALNEVVRPFGEYYAQRLPPDSSYSISERTIPVDNGEIAIRTYIPTRASGGKDATFPVYVWFHGAGWAFGGLETDDAYLRTIAVDLQVAIFSVAYRLAPEHPFPTAPSDCMHALRWVAANAASLHADPSKGFLVGGMSAGANLTAACLLLAREDPAFAHAPITGACLREPAVVHPTVVPEKYKDALRSMEEFKASTEIVYSAYERYGAAPYTDPRACPLLAPSHAGLPRTYVQVMGADPLRDDGLVYARVLREAGVETKVDEFPGAPHSFYIFQPGSEQAAKRDADERAGLRWLLRR